MNYDHMLVVCVDSGTILPLSSCQIVESLPDDCQADAEVIEYAETYGKSLVQELGL